MTTVETARVLLILGSTLFLLGAAIGVPRVWSEQDPQARQRLLEEHRGIWRVSQPFYAGGAVIAATGVGYLAADAPAGETRTLFTIACALLIVGALAWSWSVYLRAIRIADFAHGRLPGWPFTTYVWLTITALMLLGVGLLAGGYPAWSGWLTIGAAASFLAIYVRFKDIPPFVFYLLLPMVGVVML
jgi:hypothetical protein